MDARRSEHAIPRAISPAPSVAARRALIAWLLAGGCGLTLAAIAAVTPAPDITPAASASSAPRGDDPIERAARRQLAAALASLASEVALEAQTPAAVLALAPGEVIQVRPLRLQRVPAMATVRVDLLRAGQSARSLDVIFRVRAYAEVLVAPHDLRPGDRIDRAECVVVRRDIAGLLSPLVPIQEGPRSWVVRKAVPAGQPLRQDQLTTRRDVMLGDRIVLSYRGASIEVEMPATAQQDGDAGQSVRVLPQGASGALVAVVMGPGTAAFNRGQP